mmetsp:Transcript_31050/g.41034  ORF Transcript_31050/g.41034 Transcript_31050/m.41034 type:complete len:234 (-) Transcript_31050:399-1100(-)|eukprot:CAMPEP_0117754048 /NCGR_PEP_ID=MMETSP0947-20121206/12599_1 /TAXON_ID=44440 /ORGANISM="Chattonella subsalsa, Strain CCMP2191" /LENGTH=233 /DNA_ID=CAMNT_0005573067 /DNA_START=113 /DNA_END=814 /DNA_ORIENTATION=+
MEFVSTVSEIQSSEQFGQLSKAFPDEHPYTLERFLIARQMDTEAAKEALQKHIEWRNATLPIDKEAILNEARRGICFIRGTSKEGYPIIYARTRFQDPTKRDLDEALKGAVYVLEKGIEMMGEKKHSTEGRMILVFDRSNSTRANVDTELWKEIARIASDNYPERLHRVLVYPVGILFRSVWAVFKYFLDQKTRDKVILLGYQEQLLDYIDEDQLVSDLGGTNRSDFNADEEL